MKKKVTVNLKYRSLTTLWNVVKVTNSLEPTVGRSLSKSEVEALMIDPNVTVNITER